jgi:hypothetical protein|tara:strand:+ start:259 stop:375 length:117 start_codon:yes stop_codon:yes gene_type:complete
MIEAIPDLNTNNEKFICPENDFGNQIIERIFLKKAPPP